MTVAEERKAIVKCYLEDMSAASREPVNIDDTIILKVGGAADVYEVHFKTGLIGAIEFDSNFKIMSFRTVQSTWVYLDALQEHMDEVIRKISYFCEKNGLHIRDSRL